MPKLPNLSFFCPAYFDGENLPILIPKVVDFLPSVAEKYEIIIVEDGSPDNTGEVADNLARQYPNVRVVHHHKNMGYGGALKTGFHEAKYDYIMYTDGDNQFDVNEFAPHLHLLEEFDVISGYAVKKAATFRRKIQSLVFNWLVRGLFFLNLKDVNCSMKVYKRSVLDNITVKSSSAFIDAEMLIRAKRRGFKIAQFPVHCYYRTKGVASGSKPKVILTTIWDMIKFRVGLL